MLSFLKINKKTKEQLKIIKKGNSFHSLLKDLIFIRKNIFRMNCIGDNLVGICRINAEITSSDNITKLDEISDISLFLNKNIYEIFIFSPKSEVLIDFIEYSSHVVYENKLVVFTKDDNFLEIEF